MQNDTRVESSASLWWECNSQVQSSQIQSDEIDGKDEMGKKVSEIN